MVEGFIIGIVDDPIADALCDGQEGIHHLTASNFEQLLINYSATGGRSEYGEGLGAAWLSCAMRLFVLFVIALYLYYLLYHWEKGFGEQ